MFRFRSVRGLGVHGTMLGLRREERKKETTKQIESCGLVWVLEGSRGPSRYTCK